MDWLTHLQWPAMAVTVWAAWLAASARERRRRLGFLAYLAGNVLWIAWGWHAGAWALLVLQGFLLVTNIRGVRRNDPDAAPSPDAADEAPARPEPDVARAA